MAAIIKHRGMQDYTSCYREMVDFSMGRQSDDVDEVWCLQHPPVYTLGLNGKAEHILNTSEIPVVQTDRGGQVTYHGPGQLIVYCLLNMRQKQYGIKDLVTRLEQTVIDSLQDLDIRANRVSGAPGVYIGEKKIAALGIRVKRGMSWHGLALNIDMDLTPYSNINPCGYEGLEVTRVCDYVADISVNKSSTILLPHLFEQLELGAINQTPEVPDQSQTAALGHRL